MIFFLSWASKGGWKWPPLFKKKSLWPLAPLTEAKHAVKQQDFCWKVWSLWKKIDETQVGNMSLIIKSHQALWKFLKNLSWTNLTFGKKSCFHGVFHKFCHLKFMTFYNVFFLRSKNHYKNIIIRSLTQSNCQDYGGNRYLFLSVLLIPHVI